MASKLEYVRDRTVDEIKYASSTVSQNARTIGIGLSLLVYTLALAGDKTSFIRQHRLELILAGTFGVLCIVFDYLHYYFMIWENRSVIGSIRAEKAAILRLARTDPAAARLRAEQLLQAADNLRERTSWTKLREGCFHAKFAVAMLGSLTVIYMIWEILMAATRPEPVL